MPRLTAVIAEIGTTGERRRVSVTSEAWADIAEAVEREHDCHDSSCDIAAALNAGFPFSAAYLLAGATETPLLDAVCRAHGFNPHGGHDAIPDWEDWAAWHHAHGYHCDSCNGVTYDDDEWTPDTCGHCLAPLVSEGMVDDVLDGYVECALWASTDAEDDDRPLDDNYGPDDIAPEALASMREDVQSFLELVSRERLHIGSLDRGQIGHDFWLTRNRHGAGFWDRGLGGLGDKLTKLAHSFGESYLYPGADGLVRIF